MNAIFYFSLHHLNKWFSGLETIKFAMKNELRFSWKRLKFSVNLEIATWYLHSPSGVALFIVSGYFCVDLKRRTIVNFSCQLFNDQREFELAISFIHVKSRTFPANVETVPFTSGTLCERQNFQCKWTLNYLQQDYPELRVARQ